MRYAVGKGCFITVAGGNEFEDTVPPYGVSWWNRESAEGLEVCRAACRPTQVSLTKRS